MEKKAISIVLVLLLIGTIFTIMFAGSVSAMNDEQNLSGLIWKSDGTPPPQNTTFCIWVNHSGVWYRFPETDWAYTEIGIDGLSWYSYVLPDEYNPDRWADGDLYRVQVNGAPWGEFNGNTTSNGTGSAGDPVPPFNPASPASTYNTINYAPGGGYANEQQWDVRTVAPVDLAPTNITVNGLPPDPSGIPVGPAATVTIIFNVTNFGLVSTGITFTVTLWECWPNGTPIDINNPIENFTNLGPLNEYGNTSGNGFDIIIPWAVIWTSPPSTGDYYINITVDSDYDIIESDEDNNTVILFFKIGPDLTIINVLVDFQPPTDPIYVNPDELVRIDANAINVGNSPTGAGFIMTIYNITVPGGPIIPGHQAFNYTVADPLGLDIGQISLQQTWNWTPPWDAGDYYVNITVDYGDQIQEGNELNNSFELHFRVAPDLVPNNVSVDGILIVGYRVVTPLQIVTIGVNASNIGLSSTGTFTFRITYTNCSASGDTGLNSSFFTSGSVGPVSIGGFSQDVFGQWVMPFSSVVFDYYINITIDYYNEVSEINENNNYYILHLKMDAPDLTFDQVGLEVQGINVTTYTSIPPYVSLEEEVPLGVDIIIWVTVINVGGVNMTEWTNVTFYNVSGVGGPPIDPPFWEAPLRPLNAGESTDVFGIWPKPSAEGFYYINISIDYNGPLDIVGKILELEELNNTFTFIINVTSLPITSINRGTPSYLPPPDTNWRYINSSTELNFTVSWGVPPYYTWYNITWTNNGTAAKPWTNYTLEGWINFTIDYGEDTYTIYFNSTDSVGGKEQTKQKTIIVDDSPPITNIIFGNPQHRRNSFDILNITSATSIDLNGVDRPLGESPAGPGILNASGINGIPESGMFYRIQNLSSGLNETPWLEYTSGMPFYLNDPTWWDGYYRIWFNSTDNLGQKEALNYTEVYLDNTGPVTTITVGDPKHPHPTYDSYVKSSTPFTLSAFEAIGSGVNTSTIQYRISYEGGVPSGWIQATTFDIASSFMAGDGNYTIQFNARDNLTNLDFTDLIEIYVDDSPPITILNFGLPNYRGHVNDSLNISSLTTLNLIAIDGSGSGVDTTSSPQYRIYNSTYDTGWIIYTGDFTLSSNWSDGIYTIEYYSTDNLGNVEPTNNETIYLDNTPPDKLLKVIDPKYRVNDVVDLWNITSLTPLNLTADDGPGCGVNNIQYRIYNSTFDLEWTTYTGNFTFSSDWSDGIYTLEYNSSDHLGNDMTNATNINLDNIGPISSIVSDATNEKYPDRWEIDESTRFTMNADDGLGSGVLYVWYRFDTMNWRRMLWSDYPGARNLTGVFPGLIFEDIPWNHTLWIRGQDNLGNNGTLALYLIYIEGDIIPPLPPTLRLRVSDDDIILEWEPSPDEDIDHYLIYRSTTKTGFDFSDAWIDTSQNDDNGVLPLRTTWNDTGAVTGESEYYYIMRGVDIRGNIGYTSNIAGKFTMTFERGYNTFALPLEPFEDIWCSELMAEDVFADDADAIYRYHTGYQQWLGHPKLLPSSIDDFVLEMGEGYMLFIMEDQVQYTFTGSTGTSIRYIEGPEGIGLESEFRESLTAEGNENEVTLNWQVAPNATGYSIYRASARMGSDSLTDYGISPVALVSETSWVDTTADGDEYYYMVVAVNGHGFEESGTYAIGVKKHEFKAGYSVFSMELQPNPPRRIAWYTTEMFDLDSNTLYYYDKRVEMWIGHPRLVPENINNVEVSMGSAYFAYVHDIDVSYSFTGI